MRLTKTMLAAALASVVVVFSGAGELACRVCAEAPPQARKGAEDKREAKPQDDVAKYDVVAEATQPAGSPILLKITKTNAGKETLSYWVPLGAAYPPLWEKAKATDAVGNVQELPLSNGAWIGGGISGGAGGIAPGHSLTTPAAMAPLPEGAYLLEVGGASAKITVKDDAELLKKREDDLLTRIRKGEPFAQYVAAAYLTPSLRERLLRDLSATDFETAWQAVLTLYRVEKLPADAVPLLAQAIEKHLTLDKQLGLEKSRSQNRSAFWDYLTEMAGRIGSDEALDEVLKLAHGDTGVETLQAAATGVKALGMFKQERAVKELHGFLKDADTGMRYTAALTLADRRDPAAINVLVEITADGKTSWRGFACMALVNYPDDPRAEPAIKRVLDDREGAGQAKYALEQLHAARKK